MRLVRNIDGFVYRRRSDADWTMEFASEGARAVTGYDPHRLLYENRSISLFQMIDPDDRHRVLDTIAEAVARNHRFSVRYRITTAFGAPVEVEDRGIGVVGESGEIDAIEGVITVVREKPAEVRDCATDEGKFLAAFRGHAAAMVLSRTSGQICAINKALVEQYELSAHEILESGTHLDRLSRTLAARESTLFPEKNGRGGIILPFEQSPEPKGSEIIQALGAISVPFASALGNDMVLTVFPDRIRSEHRA